MQIIAIDGPAGAGKSTIARKLAELIGFLYIDSGAVYRAFTWCLLESGTDLNNQNQVQERIDQCQVSLLTDEHGNFQVLINGEPAGDRIRSVRVSGNVSLVAKISFVRRKVVALLRQFNHPRGIIMDGRDIGTVVFPDARFKIFLTASPEERARRRLLELEERGEKVNYQDILANINERDSIDSGRADSPLKIAGSGILVDTTGLDVDGVLNKLAGIINE